jgi:inward rectifier potassium channel
MSKRINDPGFGAKYSGRTKRIINKDGSFNVHRIGAETGVRSLYKELVSMSLSRFLLLVLATYISFNALFASIYYLIGIEHIQGAVGGSKWEDFLTCFYFSTQTFTTVGYGSLSPTGTATNLVASLEALCGLLAFALATGLLYGRFSKPHSRLMYSKNALVAPHGDSDAIMFRISNKRTNVLMDMEARLILMVKDDPKEPHRRSYYQLSPEVEKIHFLPLSWTIVHAMNGDSPIRKYSMDELKKLEAELLILITGFDDTFNQVVHSRHSYTFDEFVFGARFKMPYSVDKDGMIEMKMDDLHEYEKL